MSRKLITKSKCKAITRRDNPCSRSSMRNSDYCYIHSLGKVRKVPFWRNATFHAVAIVLSLTFFLMGPTKRNQKRIMKGVEEIKSFLETPNRISRFGELPLFDFRTQKEYLGTGGYNEALFITNKGRSPAINSKIRKSPLPDSPQLQALTGNQRRPNRPRTIEIPMLAVDDTRLLFKEGGYFGKKIRITIYFTIETMSPIFVYTYEGETKGLHLVERHFSNKKTSRFERF